jgi:ribonuclease HI
MKRPKVIAYTDGGCSPNPGKGGWGAYLILEGNKALMIKGFDPVTTNNKMEILASIKALETLNEESDVIIYTDSNYLKLGITQWINDWQKNNWHTSKKEPVKNDDLWKRLLALTQKHKVHWEWVKSHVNNVGNNIADSLASLAKENCTGTGNKSSIFSKNLG